MKLCQPVTANPFGRFKDVMCAACIAASVVQRAEAADGPNGAVAQIRDAWRQRFERTRNAHYAVTGNRVFPKGMLNAAAHLQGNPGDVPTGDHQAPVESRWLLDFEGNRLRSELRTEIFSERKKDFGPRWKVTVFDGSTVRVHDAAVSAKRADYGEAQWEFAIHPDSEQFLEPFDCPVFFAHGVQAVFGVAAARLMNRPLHSEQYVLHDRGVAKGRDCVILRSSPAQATPRVDEYWVDLERDGAILRWRQLQNATGELFIEAEIDYQQTPHGWYPGGWHYAIYEGNGNLLQANTVAVTEFAMNEALDKEAFSLEPRPGMFLADNVKGRLFYVASDGSVVNPPPRSAGGRARLDRRGWLLFALAFAVLAVGLAAAVIMKRKNVRVK